MRFNELSASPVPYNDTLNPILWDGDKLKTKNRYQLLFIAKHFANFLNVPNLNLRDITISGSNAAYGYSENSDLDLHLIVDIPDDRPELVELYDAKKNQYNTKFDIKIKSIPVELYVQDSKQTHTSAGIYSVLNDTWLSKPKHQAPKVSDEEVKSKARNYAGQINQALKSKDVHLAQQTMDDIRRLRKAGLDQGGEFSVENLAFKLLRTKGKIDKLRKYIDRLQSAELSIKEMGYNMKIKDIVNKKVKEEGEVTAQIKDYQPGQSITYNVGDKEIMQDLKQNPGAISYDDQGNPIINTASMPGAANNAQQELTPQQKLQPGAKVSVNTQQTMGQKVLR